MTTMSKLNEWQELKELCTTNGSVLRFSIDPIVPTDLLQGGQLTTVFFLFGWKLEPSSLDVPEYKFGMLRYTHRDTPVLTASSMGLLNIPITHLVSDNIGVNGENQMFGLRRALSSFSTVSESFLENVPILGIQRGNGQEYALSPQDAVLKFVLKSFAAELAVQSELGLVLSPQLRKAYDALLEHTIPLVFQV
jgi:hypothetical protein